MRVRRFLIIGLLVIVGVVLAAGIGLKLYLRSSGARDLASRKLTELVGMPIVVDSLDVGMADSSLSFRVLEATDSPSAKPAEILNVHSATADVSLRQLISGTAEPSEIVVDGATLNLAVGPDGKLLTKFPTAPGGTSPTTGSLPKVTIRNAEVKITQPGSEFSLSGIELHAVPKEGKVELDGQASDPKWGAWKLNGQADLASKTGRVALTTPDTHLTPELLRSIPFVPESVWKAVTATGNTAANITFEIGTNEPFRYDVVLTPKNAEIQVAAIDATFSNVTGTVKVHDAKVILENAKGTLGNGKVQVESSMDFAPEPSVLKYDIAAQDVDVTKLPPEWGLPKQITGKLRGKAKLELRVHETGKLDTHGGGVATVEGAEIVGIPAEIKLNLRSEGNRFRFHSEQKSENSRRGSRFRTTRRAVAHFANQPKQSPPAPKEKAEKAADPDDEPTTFEANIALRDVDLGQLLTRLKFDIPYKFAGKVTVKASLAVPVAKAGDTKNYRLKGTITSPSFTFQGLTVTDLSAAIEYDKGILKLTTLRGTFPRGKEPAGSFSGTATAGIEPRGDLTAKLDLERIPLGELRNAMPGDIPDVLGTVSGKATFSAPFEKLADPATWTASGSLHSDDLVLFGRTIRDANIGVKIAKGNATLENTKFTAEGIPATVDGTLALTDAYAFSATVRTAGTQVGEVAKLLPAESAPPFPLEGKFDTESRLKGKLSPFSFEASGKATATELKIGNSEANRLSLAWELTEDRVKITDLSADLFRGKVTGSANIPFSEDKSGEFLVKFTDFDSSTATKLVKDFPVRLTGLVSGSVTGTLPPAKKGEARQMTAAVDISAPKLTVQGIPAERLAGSVKLDKGAIAYSLEGRTLGGTFDVNGRYPKKTKQPVDPQGEKGSFRGRNLDLGRLANASGIAALASLRGTVDITLTYANDLSDGDGEIAIRGLAWGNARLASDLTLRLRLQDGLLTVNDFGGRFAGGDLRGRARYDLTRPGRNFFTLTIDRAQPELLLAPVPEAAEFVTGPVSIVIRGQMAPAPQGSGTVHLTRGTIAGLPANDLRIPFTWSSGNGTGRIAIRDIAGTFGGGRITGKAEYSWGYTGHLNGQFQFNEVRLQRVLKNVGGGSYFGSGRATGRLDLGGDSIRTVNDVKASLVATLNQASVDELPVVRVISPYLSTTGGLLSPFQSGDVRARLTNGIVRVERLALANQTAKLYAEGTVSLAGRLDLDVVAQTGQLGLDNRGLGLLGLRIPAFGPLPLTLIRDISEFLSNRTIRVHVGGTTRAPSVQVNAAALLTEEAIRFLVRKYTPLNLNDIPVRP